MAKTRCNLSRRSSIDTGEGSDRSLRTLRVPASRGRQMDRALVDRSAFDVVVRSRIDAVYRTSLAILGSEADAADATQETFVSAWRHRDALRDPDSFDAWLGRINLNACRAQLRSRGRTKDREIRLLDHEDDREPASADPALADRIADADAFDRAFARLSSDD